MLPDGSLNCQPNKAQCEINTYCQPIAYFSLPEHKQKTPLVYECLYNNKTRNNGQSCVEDSECKSNYCDINDTKPSMGKCGYPPIPTQHASLYYDQRTYPDINWTDSNGNTCQSHYVGCGPFVVSNILSYKL